MLISNDSPTRVIDRRGVFKIAGAAAAAIALDTVLPAAAAADAFATIPAALQPLVANGEISGAVALVATQDRILSISAVGNTTIEARRPMRIDDIFWIASMSKPIAAVAAAMLVDDGKLSFDDPVSKFVPEFALLRGAGGTAVTVRRLLSHTGGLGDKMTRDPHLTLAETAVIAAGVPLRYDVGTRWSYSTMGIDVVGRVVEVASGMPLDRFLDQRLFGPLGMTETSFWVKPTDVARYANSYRRTNGGPLERATIPYLYGTDVTDRSRPPLIGAGLFSTASDIVRIYRMMLGAGTWHGRRILRPQTVAELTRKQTGDLPARPGMPWGLGFSLVEDPAQLAANAVLSPGSFGHGGAYGTSSWADPTRGLIYVLMLQRAALPNPDNSDMRIAFQREASEAALSRNARHR